jgi:hypothetical protein
MPRQEPKEPKAFKKAPEVLQYVREIVHEHYPNLAGADIRACFGTEPQTVKGEKVAATTTILRGRVAWLTDNGGVDATDEAESPGAFFLIEVCEPVWDKLSPNQRRAQVDHQLACCLVNGKGVYKLKQEDIREFACVVHRHGAWRKGIKDFIDVAVKATAQQELELGETADGPKLSVVENAPPEPKRGPGRPRSERTSASVGV